MPDIVKIGLLKEIGWHKVKSCATCEYASNRVTFGYCQHPDAIYHHKKQGRRKLPSHAGAVCERHKWALVHGLDKLDKLVGEL